MIESLNSNNWGDDLILSHPSGFATLVVVLTVIFALVFASRRCRR